MYKNNYSRWGKWDLHVHCPGTRKNDQYNGLSLEDFCEELIKLDLTAVGITDYFSVEQAFKVKNLLKEKNSKIVVFPNMELRDDKTPNNKPLNYHVIFNPEINEEKLKSVLGRVYVNIAGSNGNRIYLDSDSEDVAERGYVKIEDLREQLCKDLREYSDFIIGVAAGSDGYRARGNSPLGQNVSRNIIECADFIFGSQKDRQYWLNPTGYDSRPRPVFRGSDAHKLDDLRGCHQGDEVTWIKAIPTMEGLLQTLVEPDSRCRIQSNFPNERNSGTWIEKIRISDRNENGAKKFSQDIYLSPGLNSIIGSRSSGKSILLSSIAHRTNPEKTEESQLRAQPWLASGRMKAIGPAAGWSWEEASSEYKVALQWNGYEDKVLEGTSPNLEDQLGNVIYIPQGYLNLIAENPEQLTEISQNSLSDQLKKLIADSVNHIQKKNQSISNFVEVLNLKIDSLGKVKEQLKEFRSISVIDEDIEQNRLRIEEMQISFSTEDRDEYNDLVSRISYGESLNNNKDVDSYRARSDDFFEEINAYARKSFEYFPLSEKIFESLNNALSAFRSIVHEKLEQYSEAEDWAIALNHETLNHLHEIMSIKFDSAFGDAGIDGEIKKLEENDIKLKEEKKTVDKLINQKIQLEKDISKCISDIDETRSEIFSLVKKFEQLFYDEGKVSASSFDGLSFTLEFGFVLSDEDYLKPLKKRGQPSAECRELLNVNSNCEVQQKFSRNMLIEILDGTVGFLSGSDSLSFGKTYAKLDFFPRIKIEYDGDVIGGFSETTMSSGKRALVGLKLLLENSEGIWPILLDQPEDDLDSRTITDLIVPYLRAARVKRQVIMVTHDANLVVGTDSENVIVANQNSVTFKNPEGIRFWYETGAFEKGIDDNESRPEPSRYFGKSRSIREHICDILDGGEDAFKKRSKRYQINFS